MEKLTQKTEEKPLVSILTSCYNHADFVEEFLDSVFSQTYSNIEFIMVDDGSSDDSVNKILNYKEKHNLDFQFEHGENKGLTKRLNELLSKSSGKYVVLIASDDVLVKDRIEKQVTKMEQNPNWAVSCGNMIEIDENGVKGKQISYPFSNGNIFKILIFNHIYVLAPTKMIRKSVYDKIGLYDETIQAEDYDFLLRVSQNHDIGFIDEVLTYYRIHSNNMHGNYPKIMKIREQSLVKFKDLPYHQEVMDKHHIDAFDILSAYKKYKKEAIHYLQKVNVFYDFKKFVKGILKLIFIWR